MHHYEQIAEDIRNVLTAQVDPSDETMRELDVRYTEAINEVNERLRKCGSLIDSGLRTEAIQECETEPNLLESVAIIDLPEFEVWADYCKQFGLPGPPRVFFEVAEQLNDSYNEEASLADLLLQHRLHALLKSPLAARLEVLRRLAHRDSGTPIWREDVIAYEQVRHNQINGEIRDALTRGDLPALAALEEEVRSNAWVRKPSQDIVAIAMDSHTKLRVRAARQKLKELVEKLTDAYSEFNVDRGRRLRSQWHAQAAIALNRDDDPLSELVEPALNWLAEQDRVEQEGTEHAAAVDAINQALDDWAPRADLERLYYRLQSFDREIDANLVKRLEERFLALSEMSRRRSRLIVAGSVASILVIGGIVAWGIYSHSRATVLAQYVAVLKPLLESGNFGKAETYLGELQADDADAYSSEVIQGLAEKTRMLHVAEDGRKARFNQLLKSAEEAGTTWIDHGAALGFLSDAKKLARDDLELTGMAQVESRIKSIRRRLQKEYDEKFAEDLSRYTRECEDVEETDLEALKQLIQRGDLLKKQPRVSDVLLAQIAPLVQQLNAKRDTELRSRDESQRLAAIDRSVGDRRSFKQAIEAYAEAFPQAVRAVSYKSVLDEEAKLWDGIDQWSTFIATWEKCDFRYLTPEVAANSIADAEALIEQHPGFPAEANVKRVLEFLKPITHRTDDEGRSKHLALIGELTENLPDLRMALAVRDGQFYRYYFSPTKPIQKLGDDLSIRYFVDTGFEGTKSIRLARDSIQNGPDWTAPQTKFSQLALDRMANFEVTQWDRHFYVLTDLLDQTDGMAPQVRIQLLKLFLDVGCEGSLPMREAYREHRNLIDATNLPPNPTWVDPEDFEGKQTSTKANGLLERLGFRTLSDPNPTAPHDLTWKKVVELLDEMQSPELGERYQWIGWLREDNDQDWTVVFGPETVSDADLFVIHFDPDGQPVITKLGAVKEQEIDIDRAAREALKVGRLVYTVAQ